METRIPVLVTSTAEPSRFNTYGTIDCGAEMMTKAWTTMDHRFAIRRMENTTRSKTDDEKTTKDNNDWNTDNTHDQPTKAATKPAVTQVLYGPHRPHTRLLQQLPVDILVIERGHLRKPLSCLDPSTWETMIETASPATRPALVIEM